jgi:hypothetical protein
VGSTYVVDADLAVPVVIRVVRDPRRVGFIMVGDGFGLLSNPGRYEDGDGAGLVTGFVTRTVDEVVLEEVAEERENVGLVTGFAVVIVNEVVFEAAKGGNKATGVGMLDSKPGYRQELLDSLDNVEINAEEAAGVGTPGSKPGYHQELLGLLNNVDINADEAAGVGTPGSKPGYHQELPGLFDNAAINVGKAVGVGTPDSNPGNSQELLEPPDNVAINATGGELSNPGNAPESLDMLADATAVTATAALPLAGVGLARFELVEMETFGGLADCIEGG